MQSVTFRRIAPDDSRIYHDGEVYRLADCLKHGSHYYVIHLDEDFRGPIRVHQRSRIREVTERLVDTHPLR